MSKKRGNISKSWEKAQLQFTKPTYPKASSVLSSIRDVFLHALSAHYHFIPIYILMKFLEFFIMLSK